jgi:hypothetical protein
MRKPIVMLAVAGVIGLAGRLSVAQDKDKVTLFSLLTEQQRTEFGLSKLSDDERKGLDKWATGMVISAMQSARQPVILDPSELEGAIILASDDEILGKITTNTFDEKSLGNEFGMYGNEFKSKSLFNKFSKYADAFSNTSAFCTTATKPPQILLKGKTVGFLTVNKTLSPSINPYTVFGYCKYGR